MWPHGLSESADPGRPGCEACGAAAQAGWKRERSREVIRDLSFSGERRLEARLGPKMPAGGAVRASLGGPGAGRALK